jgi:Arc/MetJ family transcription regulator
VRTNIVLDETLVKEATILTGVRTKRELIDLALRELIRSRCKLNLFDLAGKIQLVGDCNHKQLRELRQSYLDK